MGTRGLDRLAASLGICSGRTLTKTAEAAQAISGLKALGTKALGALRSPAMPFPVPTTRGGLGVAAGLLGAHAAYNVLGGDTDDPMYEPQLSKRIAAYPGQLKNTAYALAQGIVDAGAGTAPGMADIHTKNMQRRQLNDMLATRNTDAQRLIAAGRALAAANGRGSVTDAEALAEAANIGANAADNLSWADYRPGEYIDPRTGRAARLADEAIPEYSASRQRADEEFSSRFKSFPALTMLGAAASDLGESAAGSSWGRVPGLGAGAASVGALGAAGLLPEAVAADVGLFAGGKLIDVLNPDSTLRRPEQLQHAARLGLVPRDTGFIYDDTTQGLAREARRGGGMFAPQPDLAQFGERLLIGREYDPDNQQDVRAVSDLVKAVSMAHQEAVTTGFAPHALALDPTLTGARNDSVDVDALRDSATRAYIEVFTQSLQRSISAGPGADPRQRALADLAKRYGGAADLLGRAYGLGHYKGVEALYNKDPNEAEKLIREAHSGASDPTMARYLGYHRTRQGSVVPAAAVTSGPRSALFSAVLAESSTPAAFAAELKDEAGGFAGFQNKARLPFERASVQAIRDAHRTPKQLEDVKRWRRENTVVPPGLPSVLAKYAPATPAAQPAPEAAGGGSTDAPSVGGASDTGSVPAAPALPASSTGVLVSTPPSGGHGTALRVGADVAIPDAPSYTDPDNITVSKAPTGASAPAAAQYPETAIPDAPGAGPAVPPAPTAAPATPEVPQAPNTQVDGDVTRSTQTTPKATTQPAAARPAAPQPATPQPATPQPAAPGGDKKMQSRDNPAAAPRIPAPGAPRSGTSPVPAATAPSGSPVPTAKPPDLSAAANAAWAKSLTAVSGWLQPASDLAKSWKSNVAASWGQKDAVPQAPSATAAKPAVPAAKPTVPARPAGPGITEATFRQAAMRDANFNPGPVDGRWGPSSSRAWEAYTKAVGGEAEANRRVKLWTSDSMARAKSAPPGQSAPAPSGSGGAIPKAHVMPGSGVLGVNRPVPQRSARQWPLPTYPL